MENNNRKPAPGKEPEIRTFKNLKPAKSRSSQVGRTKMNLVRWKIEETKKMRLQSNKTD